MTSLRAFGGDVPRIAGGVGVGFIAIAAVASIVSLIVTPTSGLLLQGPAAVDPNIASELSVLFDTSVVVVTQRVLHIAGILLFLGLAGVLIARQGASRGAPLAALTLAALGVALFAPLADVPSGPTMERIIGSITPQSLAGFWGSLAGLSLIAFLATFPDGRWTPSWTRWLLVAAATTGLLSVPWPGGPWDPTVWPRQAQVIWLISVPAAAVAAQTMRRRHARLARATRPVVVSLLLALGAFVLLWVIQPELTPGALDLVVVTPRLRAVYALNLLVLLTIAIFSFPLSVSVSIVKYRLFDVDLIVNRAIVYGIVTGLLGISFVGLAVAAATLLNLQLSGLSGSVAGLIGVTMGVAVVLAFQPLRRRVQREVDRRFYRERYDAQQLLDGFAAEMTRLITTEGLEAGLVTVVDTALRPSYVTLHTGPFSGETTDALGGRGVVDLTTTEPIEGPFSAVESGVLVPLLAGGSLAGVLEVGERASQTRYSRLDLDLLDRLGRVGGPALQLAHEVEIRERNAKDQQRAVNELELARKIQQGLLPHTYPDIDGWSFDAFYQPAREVGGDFYDWIDLPDGRLGLVIGDVSDKGIPAALVMATCRTLLRSSASAGRSPGYLLAEVNNRLQPDVPAGMFVTCLMAALDPDTGEISLANAGHNLPYVCDSDGTDEITVRGMPLGLMADMEYEEISARIPMDGTLVLTSDGLAESHGPAGEMFGTGRVRDSLSANGRRLLTTALEAHRAFVGPEWDQEDDMTIVTVRRGTG